MQGYLIFVSYHCPWHTEYYYFDRYVFFAYRGIFQCVNRSAYFVLQIVDKGAPQSSG